RTPLNAIFGFTALARQSIHDPEALQTYLNRVERSGHQLLDLIDKVLNVSWSGSNEATALEDECGLCEIIQEV
ncbi:hybrid sensor histidine kinase/response regulator, partial [Klebsiella oxytoca]